MLYLWVCVCLRVCVYISLTVTVCINVYVCAHQLPYPMNVNICGNVYAYVTYRIFCLFFIVAYHGVLLLLPFVYHSPNNHAFKFLHKLDAHTVQADLYR